MKNMKVARKLVFSFLIVTGFAIIVGAMGIVGMYLINKADDDMYTGNFLPTVLADEISQNIVEHRVYMRNFVIYDAVDDAKAFQETEKKVEDSVAEMEGLFADYDKTIVNQIDQNAFDEFLDVYHDEWLPLIERVHSLGLADRTEEAKLALSEGVVIAEKMDELSDTLQEVNIADAETAVKGNSTLFMITAFLEAGALVVAVAVALFFAFYISGLIAKPLGFLSQALEGYGLRGDTSLPPEAAQSAAKCAMRKDEIGTCSRAFGAMLEHILKVEQTLGRVADGDLTAELKTLSEKDTMGIAINKMIDNLDALFHDIRMASDQVSSGAMQVSQGAQGLAAGSSEQAASIEELSTSLAELQDQTDHNAADSGKAREANNKAAKGLDDSIRSMGQMLEAMREIDESSASITKVIKVIDDIAFQTNILALNAAVEAARAGQHGKGFAVVADEVRNLAAKSAEAAKETSALIAGSTERVKEGNEIVAKTNANLETAVSSAKESTRLIDQVTTASIAQAKAITEITRGMEQISVVIQANSATAEQSAAASEEMSAQAVVLNEIVGKFNLKQGGGGFGDTNQFSISAQSEVAEYAGTGSKY